MRLALTISLLTFALVFPRIGMGQEKERMIFEPGSKEPKTSTPTLKNSDNPVAQATPSAVPEPAQTPKPLDSPAEKIDLFFLALKAGQTDAAYDALVKDSVIAERKDDVTALKQRTKQAIDSYGPISGYEEVDEKAVGTHLLRRTCISLNSDLPLRWRFYFYRVAEEWRLVDLRVDDALVELFEESGRPKK